MTAIEAITAADAATTEEELDALLVDETRVTVLAAVAARLEALNADDDADDEVEVTTLGEVGTSKSLTINGVASVVPCGIVMRVTPEVAEQLRQCNLI